MFSKVIFMMYFGCDQLSAQAPGKSNWSDPKSQKYVLYDANTQFFSSTKAEPIPIKRWGTTASPLALRWVGHQEGWDSLENVAHILFTPSDSLKDFQKYKLRLQARQKSRLKVVSKLFVHQDKAGRETWIFPGLPVHSENRQWLLGSKGTDIGSWLQKSEFIKKETLEKVKQISIAEAYIGDSFQPDSITNHIKTKSHSYCILDNGLLKKGESCRAKPTKKTPGKKSENDIEERKILKAEKIGTIYRLRKKGDQLLGLIKKQDWLYQEIPLKESSDHAERLAESTAVMQVLGSMSTSSGGGPLSAFGGETRRSFLAKKGATVFWMNGVPAGRVRSQHVLYKKQLFLRNELQCTGLPWRFPEVGFEALLRGEKATSKPAKPPEKHPFAICYQQKDLVLNSK